MLKNWLKIFVFQLKNNKFFTALNILGLSIGIAGLVFSILYWNEEHSYNAWNPGKEKEFQVVSDLGEGMVWATSTATLQPFLKNSFPEIESYFYYSSGYESDMMEYNGKREIVDKILDAQSNLFSFFPFEFTEGNAKTALSDNSSIAISETTKKRFFGHEEAIGKQIIYKGKSFVIRGIYKIPGKSSLAPEVVLSSIDERLNSEKDNWGNFSYTLMLKLKDPKQANLVKKKIENIYLEYRTKKSAKEEGMSLADYVKRYGNTKIILESLESSRLHSITDGYPEGRGNYQFLLIMLGLSVLILILSIVNYVNLATANAIKRAKEVGVRKILGASKTNVVLQFLFETVIMTGFSILLALVIVELSLPYYNDFLGKTLEIHGSQFYGQLILIFTVVVVLAGIFPAIYVSGFDMLKVLKGNFGRSKSGIWLRNGMLILQFAIASFFIVGSYIVYEQVHFMSSKDLGFKGEQILVVNYRNPYDYNEKGYLEKLFRRYETVKQEIQKMKGVEQVSAGAFSFGNGATTFSGFTYNGIDISSSNMSVDFGLLDMMKIKMAQGRNLSPQFASDTISSILINETTMHLMKEKNPVGKTIDWNEKKLKIVGVVKDFHVNGPQQKIPPMTFFHLKTIDWMLGNTHNIYIRANPENMEQAIAQLENFWQKKVDPDYPFTYDFVDKTFARTYENYVKQRNLFSLLNIVVIVIALFGLFALATYSIQRRMKEIAIRKTLGAETKTLLKELSKQYLVFCVTGFLIALFPAYYLLDKWLENFAYRIPISFVPFAIGFVILLLLTLVIVLSRAYQATRENMLKYLKYE